MNHKYIKRIDRSGTNEGAGWYVDIYYRGEKLAAKYFSDIKSGGKKKAEDCAIKFRNKILNKHKITLTAPGKNYSLWTLTPPMTMVSLVSLVSAL